MDEIKNLVKKLQWYQEKEFPYSPEGIDDIIYTTELFEYIIEIYPRTLISKNQQGWEYKIYDNITKDVFDSIIYNNPKSLSDAKILSISKILEMKQLKELKLNERIINDFNKHMNILRDAVKNNNNTNTFLKQIKKINELITYKLELSRNPKEYILFITDKNYKLKAIEYHFEKNEIHRVYNLDTESTDYTNLLQIFKFIMIMNGIKI
ncbi:MAG: hypothetical protein QXL84_06100 [Thermoplasmata archaeon]